MIDHHLVSEVNKLYNGVGDKISTKYNKVIDLIDTWEPTQHNLSIDIIEYAKNKYTTLTNQVLGLYSTYDINFNLGEDKDAFKEQVEQYTRLFSSLMQFIGLPDFDYSLVANLKDIPSLKFDDVFYIYHSYLNTQVDTVLADGSTYIGVLLNIFNEEVSDTGYISLTDLDTWASSITIEEGEVIEGSTFPAVVYNLIIKNHEDSTTSSPSLEAINTRIQQVVTDIINFLTYNEFKQEPVFIESDKKPVPAKSDLKKKVYTTHRLRLFREFCGLTSPEEEKEEEVTRGNILI